MKSRKIKILLFISGIVLLALMILLTYNLFIQADTVAVTVRGTIFLGLSDTTSGPPASGAQVSLIDYKGTKWDTKTDQYGNYSFVLDKLVGCNYRVVLSGADYNAREAGKISLASVKSNPRQVFNYPINKEVDSMWSHYFNASYPTGYADSRYHFSKWDLYYLRNQITIDQVLDKKAPKSASFEIPFQGWQVFILNQQPGGGENIWGAFQVAPVTKDWTNASPALVGKPLLTVKKKLIDLNNEGKIKFAFDYGDLDEETRYKSWIYGFEIAADFYLGDNEGNPVKDTSGADINPDLRIYRSEDNGGKPVAPIIYTGLETLVNTDLFTEPVAAPHDGRDLSSDYGYRTFGRGWHDGLDLVGGSSAYAVNPGRVEYVNNGVCGVGIRIHHPNDVTTHYCHLSKTSAGRIVKNGAEVCTGQKIGTTDSSGRITGPHLHFGVKKSGSFIDPFPYFNQFIESISAKYFKGWKNRDFNSRVDQPHAKPN